MRKVILSTLLLVSVAVVSQDGNTQGSLPDSARVTSSVSNPQANRADIETDLQRMRVLLGQMQRNVAFVSAGDTPLKHQFELELQMWQLLIQEMEKNAATKTSQ